MRSDLTRPDESTTSAPQIGLQITYLIEGDRDIPTSWRRITVDVNEQAVRRGGSATYGYGWATNRVREHHADPTLGVHVFDIDRTG